MPRPCSNGNDLLPHVAHRAHSDDAAGTWQRSAGGQQQQHQRPPPVAAGSSSPWSSGKDAHAEAGADHSNDVLARLRGCLSAAPALPPAAASAIAGGRELSIYALRSRRRQMFILAAVALISITLPLSDTVYLPALLSIQHDLRASSTLVSTSVAIYAIAVGVFSSVWGPASDRFGRKGVLLTGTALFAALSVACAFAPNITALLVLRGLQGASVACFGPTCTGVLADIFDPSERGMACGVFAIPLLLGPICGPLLGGVLSQMFGWRSTMLALAVFAAVIITPLLVFGVPETHQHRVLHGLLAAHPHAHVIEAQEILRQPPRFSAPWRPVLMLLQPDTVLHVLAAVLVFACMFVSLCELPGALAAPPYGLQPGIIGLAYLPSGVGGIMASPLGGKLSDMGAAQRPGQPHARLAYGNAGVLLLMPASLAAFGWAAHFKQHLALLLAANAMLSVANECYMPGVFAYLTIIHQQAASAAASGLHALLFGVTGVLIVVSSAAVQAVGFGPFFTGAAALVAALTAVAGLQVLRSWQRGGVVAAKAEEPC